MTRSAVQRLLEAQAREHSKQIAGLFTIISEQNDRIMYLAGRTWGLPPQAPEPEREVFDEFLDTAAMPYLAAD